MIICLNNKSKVFETVNKPCSVVKIWYTVVYYYCILLTVHPLIKKKNSKEKNSFRMNKLHLTDQEHEHKSFSSNIASVY